MKLGVSWSLLGRAGKKAELLLSAARIKRNTLFLVTKLEGASCNGS